MTVTHDDIARMRGQLFVEGGDARARLTRFWMLLVLSAIIATAGVVADSTATVIGAMIVAPLMTPILGIVLGVVLGDRANVARSVALVVAGALAVVAVAWLIGRIVTVPVVELSNSQVAGRVHPRLIDLLAALATGVVGSFALVRRDISDTLPGVAIAISLVPPLAVVGLTLESGEPAQARGALLLFVTNVAAILATGVIVMALSGVHRFGPEEGTLLRSPAIALMAALFVLVFLPLAATTRIIALDTRNEQRIRDVADSWAAGSGWEVVQVTTQQGSVVVRAIGPGDPPDTRELRRALRDADLADVPVRVDLVPELRVDLADDGGG
ncbi:MAG: DUF389 domain-containing protein [Actinobacteria bacterium]|nr:DUF389 domain-containing protein [Actinomycetota bacterium]